MLLIDFHRYLALFADCTVVSNAARVVTDNLVKPEMDSVHFSASSSEQKIFE